MISSQEFQQKLQAGKIHEALALVVRDASNLDITTQIAEPSSSSSQFAGSEYLRTKINLLTGDVQNEVGEGLVNNNDTYHQLQQLHTERIVASHQQIQGYLDRIKAILTVSSPTQLQSRSSLDPDRLDWLNSASLVAILNRATENYLLPQQPESITTADLTCAQRDADRSGNRSHGAESLMCDDTISQQIPALTQPHWSENSDLLALEELMPTSGERAAKKMPLANLPMADDLDRSIDERRQVGEEWGEDEDVGSAAAIPDPPTVAPTAPIPNWQDRSIRRQLNPLDVKPIIPRLTSGAVEPLPQWDKFEPEYIGISAEDLQQPQLATNRDSPQMDKLLADLDI
jgi:hypothetical protein